MANSTHSGADLLPQRPPNEAQIAERAYQRWLRRGRPITDGREDWFAAQAELRAEQSPASGSPRSALRRIRS